MIVLGKHQNAGIQLTCALFVTKVLETLIHPKNNKIVRSSYKLRKMILQTILGMWSCYKCRNCLGQRALQPKHTKYLALWLKRRELYKCLGVGAKLEKLTPQANRSLTKRDNAAPNNSQNNIRLSLCA